MMLKVGLYLSFQRMILYSIRFFIPRTFIPPRDKVESVEGAITLQFTSLGQFAAKSLTTLNMVRQC